MTPIGYATFLIFANPQLLIIPQVRDLLSDSYSVISVDDVVAETGDHALYITVQGSESDAESMLKMLTVMTSPYTIIANPPFDVVIVMIQSSRGNEILGTAVMREHVEAWLDGSISPEEYVNRWILMTP